MVAKKKKAPKKKKKAAVSRSKPAPKASSKKKAVKKKVAPKKSPKKSPAKQKKKTTKSTAKKAKASSSRGKKTSKVAAKKSTNKSTIHSSRKSSKKRGTKKMTNVVDTASSTADRAKYMKMLDAKSAAKSVGATPCSNCLVPSRCRRRTFSEQAWVVLLLWGEISADSVDQPICEQCYTEMREILIDRTDEIEAAMQQQEEVARIKQQIGSLAS